MTEFSNIAIDVAEVFERFRGGKVDLSGAQYLAMKFEVEPFGREFFDIISAILGEIDALHSIIENGEIREPVKSRNLSHLATLRQAFDQNSLNQQWQQRGLKQSTAAHTDPILSLGQSLGALDYRKPSPEEVEEMAESGVDLLDWLREHQFEQQDFVRACLISGVERFLFRLDKLQWVGWGYAVESLREVVGAYLALERGIDPEAAPMEKAALQKISAKLRKAFEIVSAGRETVDNAAFLLSVYQRGGPAVAYVAGFLTAN